MCFSVSRKKQSLDKAGQSGTHKSRLLMITNNPDTLVSHRLSVAVAALENGYDVHVATPDGESIREIQDHGLVHHTLPLSRGGMNPLTELWSLLAFVCLFLRLRPDIVHLITIKPLLYGGIAARMTRVPAVVTAVAGLGYVFTAESARARWIRRLIMPVYKFALGHANQYVIFQNTADRDVLTRLGLLHTANAALIHGSGVNLNHYPFREEPRGTHVITLASRLLREKGVHEFREAAFILRERGIKARFWLIGTPDEGNPGRITEEELDTWRQEGLLEILGFRDDIPELFSQSHIVTLPSFYGEGLPKVLIEAAACGRAVITTDIPGCRDAIRPEETGLLVPARDPRSLANALEKLIHEDNLRQDMGRHGRILAEECFRIEAVITNHLEIYDQLIKARRENGRR